MSAEITRLLIFRPISCFAAFYRISLPTKFASVWRSNCFLLFWIRSFRASPLLDLSLARNSSAPIRSASYQASQSIACSSTTAVQVSCVDPSLKAHLCVRCHESSAVLVQRRILVRGDDVCAGNLLATKYLDMFVMPSRGEKT